MEFTARVGSILRGLLPHRWITESGGRQRLGGLFECLLQKAGVPPPTFYAATPSVCSGNRLASPVHTYCAWIRPSSPDTPSAPVAGRISKHEHERFLSQLFHPIGRFHWKFPREKIVSSYRVPWISCFPPFPFRTLESIRKFSLLTERIKLYVDYSSFGGISQVSRGKKNEKIGNSERKLGNVGYPSHPLSKGPSSKNSSSHGIRLIRNSRLDLVTTRFNPTGDKIEADRS